MEWWKKLVVKEVKKEWREVAGQGTWAAVFLVAYVSVGGRRKKCKGEEETKKGVWLYIYKREKLYNMLSFKSWLSLKRLRL